MFPGFAVAVSGLKPKQKYSMKMEMVLAENHRFKFLNCQWIAVGSADPQPPSIMCVHPDSPNSGSYWMRQGVSFRKTKITNNKDNPKGNVSSVCMLQSHLHTCGMISACKCEYTRKKC